jgi:dsDNA-specific endonuclease/ATPase MutS2
MSKKAILTDFSALKGKITLSDAKDITTPQPKLQTQPQQPNAKETHLKVGRQVVLMDSSLRGHIVSLGKRVGIELEDGLLIEAAYGEFAVTDGTELERLKSSKVKHIQTVTRTPRSKAPGCLEIDLHIEAIPGGRSVPKGQQLQFQMDTFRRVIRDNMSHKGRKISFIHGIGDGILKEAIRKELDEVFALRCTYSVGDPAVTVVTIR